MPGSTWFGLMVSVLPVGIVVVWLAMRFLRPDRTVPASFHGRTLTLVAVLLAVAVLAMVAAFATGRGDSIGEGPAFATILLAMVCTGNAFWGFVVTTLLRVFPQAPRAPGA